MAETYGARWTSAMGEKPNDTWRRQLKPLMQYQWLRGIERLHECVDEWPPTLPEFRRWCLGLKTSQEAKAEAIRDWEEKGLGRDKYNPRMAGRSYEQIERDKQAYVNSRIAMNNEFNEAVRKSPLYRAEPLLEAK